MNSISQECGAAARGHGALVKLVKRCELKPTGASTPRRSASVCLQSHDIYGLGVGVAEGEPVPGAVVSVEPVRPWSGLS